MDLGGVLRTTFVKEMTERDSKKEFSVDVEAKAEFMIKATASFGTTVSDSSSNAASSLQATTQALGGNPLIWLQLKDSQESLQEIQEKWAETITDKNLYPTR